MPAKTTVYGIHAPAPRPTVWAALLLAVGLSLVFLTGLWVVVYMA